MGGNYLDGIRNLRNGWGRRRNLPHHGAMG